MKEIYKTKRKMHFLINYIFYFIFFGAGFLAGGGNINKILEFFN